MKLKSVVGDMYLVSTNRAAITKPNMILNARVVPRLLAFPARKPSIISFAPVACFGIARLRRYGG